MPPVVSDGIYPGRNGQAAWNAPPYGSPHAVQPFASINGFTVSMKPEFEDVTVFGKKNRVYLPGTKAVSGTMQGFLDHADVSIIQATSLNPPGMLRLIPTLDNMSPDFYFEGPAYLDADVNCTLQAPKITSNWRAAGDWELPG